MAANAISTMPRIADWMCPPLAMAADSRGPCLHTLSRIASRNRFSMLLPKMVPSARSAPSCPPNMATALMPVIISGREVMMASSSRPTQTPPRPVFSAMMSPYCDSFVPKKRMRMMQMAKYSQTKTDSFPQGVSK